MQREGEEGRERGRGGRERGEVVGRNRVSCAVQAFCSSITGMLATLAILKGVGVGDSSATPLAAALTWMLKGNPPTHTQM